ncbi:unnamed protein product [Didymodactylos carnosus]|uniref:Uncharacterized protein n=1 Tax=Didymodactylos carnosus TaxID=1234261 RepID=A0A815VKF6_9BILA|nr:unnamed protein product [Didymodactylos carnosus]CAF1531585.1 unnamed protein product [Didymodactylos carnosus]CAF4014515.1 unnamed protein product [Didymodactylos carnosus]CAF4390900.1 unnamed protein product [Didymodactylos carnosus]
MVVVSRAIGGLPIEHSLDTIRTRWQANPTASRNSVPVTREIYASKATTMHIATCSKHKRQKIKSTSKTPLPSCMKTTSLLGSALHWPKYGINRCVLDGQIYTVSNAYSLDSVLFVMYSLYSRSGHEYQEIFDTVLRKNCEPPVTQEP